MDEEETAQIKIIKIRENSIISYFILSFFLFCSHIPLSHFPDIQDPSNPLQNNKTVWKKSPNFAKKIGGKRSHDPEHKQFL